MTTTARPTPDAALLRTVTVRTITGLTTHLQHWAQDARAADHDGWERREWITATTYSGDTECGLQARRYTPATLDQCRADWTATMATLQHEWARGLLTLTGDPSSLPPAPYSIAVDLPSQGAPRREQQRRTLRPAPAPDRGRLTLDMIASLTFAATG